MWPRTPGHFTPSPRITQQCKMLGWTSHHLLSICTWLKYASSDSKSDELVILHWFPPVFKIIPRIKLAQRRRGTLQMFLQEDVLQERTAEPSRAEKLGCFFDKLEIPKVVGSKTLFHVWYTPKEWWIELLWIGGWPCMNFLEKHLLIEYVLMLEIRGITANG